MSPKPDPFLSGYYDQSAPKRGIGFHAASLAVLILTPWLIFTTVCCLLTFAYHHFRVLVWVLIFLGALISMLFIALSTRNRRGPIYLFLGVLCVFAILLSTVLGLYCYHSYAIQFWSCEEGRAYVNVRPDEAAGGHADAGRLTFSEDAHVDTGRSVGYRSKDGSMYCVAPIMGQEDPTTVEYWAAGLDCCGQRGNFNCDSAWDEKAKSGVVMVDQSGPFAPKGTRETYMKAAQEAAGAYEFKLGKHPLFVRWVRDAQVIQDAYWNDCMVFLVCVCFVHLMVSIMFGIVLHFSTGTVRARKA